MPTDTKLNQLIINQLTQEQYDEAKAAGTLSDTELYITDSDDEALTNNNISNCITEIPQDIKLELNNGTLTLKAGSKVYKGDGTVVNITGDIIIHSGTLDSQTALFMVFIDINNVAVRVEPRLVASGNTNPGSGYYVWFDTSNKVIKQSISADGNFTTVLSLPIGIYQRTNGVATRIDQVFNGFGYIGSTVFALPGVKGLIPNGRNADGSLKNITVEFTNVMIQTFPSNLSLDVVFGAGTSDVTANGAYKYNEQNNYNYDGSTIWPRCYYAIGHLTNGKISSFTPKTPFHALDYNDKSTISGWSMPSSRYINLTLGADGTTYVAPANGYFYVKKDFSASGQYIWFELYNSTDTVMDITIWGSTNGFISGFIPVSKGMKVRIHYTASGSTLSFRFIYAEGEN